MRNIPKNYGNQPSSDEEEMKPEEESKKGFFSFSSPFKKPLKMLLLHKAKKYLKNLNGNTQKVKEK